MKITVNNTTYTQIKNLSFAPETDVTGDSLPINDFEAVILTSDSIRYGEWAYLYDDLDNLWAKYWICYSEHENSQTVRIRAESQVSLLERRKLPATMYDDGISVILTDIFGSIPYEVDDALSSVIYGEGGAGVDEVAINGFCPEQSARERLVWVCLTVGAYVRTYFTDKIILSCLTDDTVLVPVDKTFWKPAQTFRDYVTSLRVHYYSYEIGDPETTDSWVTDGIDIYLEEDNTAVLANPYAPVSAPENVVELEGITLVNEDNVDGVLSFLASYYFNRTEVSMDVINNAEYMPGQKVIGYVEENRLVRGYIQSADFRFGVQARSNLKLLGVTDVTGDTLIILYKYQQIQLDMKTFFLPTGHAYSFPNPYIDWTMDKHRYIYIPDNENATGIVAAGGSTNVQNYDIALDHHRYNVNFDYDEWDIHVSFPTSDLAVYSVDELELVQETETVTDPDTGVEVEIEYYVLEIS